MKLEWSDEALADLDRFVEFLNQQQPSLAPLVAKEIVDKVQVLSAHPQLGRPITGREEKLSICRPRAPHLVVPAQYSLTRRRPVEPVFQSANEVRCAKRTPRRTGCPAFAGHDDLNVLKRF